MQFPSPRSGHGFALPRLLMLILALALVLAAVVGWWLERPLSLRSPVVDLSIEAGSTPREIARDWVKAGVDTSPWLLYQWFRWSGQSRQIKAGSYELAQGASAHDLLRMMVRGDESLSFVRLIEGWTFQRFRQELAEAADLQHATAALTDAQIMAQLGMAGVPAEGRFFPDTYAFAKGSSDIAVLRRAAQAMNKQLEAAWAVRAPNTPLKSPEQALILAS
ncbi:MAG TPA: endolytic transglycosylase MltG, partial [Aquabacterium sp.]|nr:endolytic transglycosylase MltG [Aquabacterium sp.]